MNREAMRIPKERLHEALLDRKARKEDEIAERDARYGADRIRVGSYMENIGWPDLFGFDMNDYFANPDLMFELQLRERIFWADNSRDDSPVGFGIGADVGMYYDMTLFGASIRHARDGVPIFDPHPLGETPDPSFFASFDFYHTGAMPALIAQYHRLKEISEREHGGLFSIGFPNFHRGPLDIYIQLRGFERFCEDAAERPEIIDESFARIGEARRKFAKERAEFLGADLPKTSFVADDWFNVPFLSPKLIRRFAIPAYKRIEESEGRVLGFHTCGRLEPVVLDLLEAFPYLEGFDVSGWNDLELLHRIVPQHVAFGISYINTFVLTGAPEEHRAKFETIRKLKGERGFWTGAHAIVNLCGTYEESLARMNAFIELAREVLR